MILVTGGAGYIGGVTTELLRDRGEQVVVLDNLMRGHRAVGCERPSLLPRQHRRSPTRHPNRPRAPDRGLHPFRGARLRR